MWQFWSERLKWVLYPLYHFNFSLPPFYFPSPLYWNTSACTMEIMGIQSSCPYSSRKGTCVYYIIIILLFRSPWVWPSLVSSADNLCKQFGPRSGQAFSFLNSFLASGNFCRLLITFENSLDPDQAQQNVRPDLDPSCLTHTLMVFVKNFLEKAGFWKTSADDKKHAKLPSRKSKILLVPLFLPFRTNVLCSVIYLCNYIRRLFCKQYDTILMFGWYVISMKGSKLVTL